LEQAIANVRYRRARLAEGDTNVSMTGTDEGFWGLLTATERMGLSALGRESTFARRATICVEGEPATYVFVLLDGWAKIFTVTEGGHEVVLALRGQGDIVGEIAGETTGHRTATVQAIEAVHALIVGFDRFSSFLDSNPGAARAYRRVVTQRWSDAATMLRIRAVTSGAQRLAQLLLDLAGRHGKANDGEIHVTMPLTQEELASLAGTSRATVTRAYSDWRHRNLIRTGQRHLTIINAAGLRQVAGQRT
jgi:CRP/FNR family cyclic AMP-dependent transcriptional regulator